MASTNGNRAGRWRVVRIPAALADRLDALAAELMSAHVEGRAGLPNEYVEHCPLHHVIDRAVAEFEGHRERSKRPARRRSATADPGEVHPTPIARVEA